MRLSVAVPVPEDEGRAYHLPAGTCQLLFALPSIDLRIILGSLTTRAARLIIGIVADTSRHRRIPEPFHTAGGTQFYSCADVDAVFSLMDGDAERWILLPDLEESDVIRRLSDFDSSFWSLRRESIEGALVPLLKEDGVMLLFASDHDHEAIGSQDAVLSAARIVIDLYSPLAHRNVGV